RRQIHPRGSHRRRRRGVVRKRHPSTRRPLSVRRRREQAIVSYRAPMLLSRPPHFVCRFLRRRYYPNGQKPRVGLDLAAGVGSNSRCFESNGCVHFMTRMTLIPVSPSSRNRTTLMSLHAYELATRVRCARLAIGQAAARQERTSLPGRAEWIVVASPGLVARAHELP